MVMNDLGNLIQPVGIAKVDPKRQSITLESGQVFKYSISKQLLDLAKGKELSLPFLTGTALFGYALEKDKTYRIIVVYRPYGKEKEGICSKEKLINFKIPSAKLDFLSDAPEFFGLSLNITEDRLHEIVKKHNLKSDNEFKTSLNHIIYLLRMVKI